MTFREIYEWGAERLRVSGVEESRLDAWYLLEYISGISRAVFLADSKRPISAQDEERYREVIARRAKRIPLQHITGVQEFMGLEFCVNEHVLIPRQDTEVLAETALEKLKQDMLWNQKEDTVRILDMCTGTGCILLSVLYYARQDIPGGLEKMIGIGADISKEAVRVAKQNADRLGIAAKWVESDLFSGIEGEFDMIVSNPPYIPSAAIEGLQPEVREHDPRLALDGREDGLYFYRKVTEEARKYLKSGGRLLFEIGAEQGKSVSEYMKKWGYTEVTLKKDLAGLDRVVSGVYDTCESF